MVTKPAPPGQEFWLHDGRQVKSIKELSEYLQEASKADYAKHVSKDRNDFSNWVRHVHKKEAIARAMENTSSRKEAAFVLDEVVKKQLKNRNKESKRTKPIKAPGEPEKKIVTEVAREVEKQIESQILKTEAHTDAQEFITKEFVFGFIFGLIIGLLATGIINALG